MSASATARRDLEGTVLGETGQTERDRCPVTSRTCGLQKTKRANGQSTDRLTDTETVSTVAGWERGWEKGEKAEGTIKSQWAVTD